MKIGFTLVHLGLDRVMDSMRALDLALMIINTNHLTSVT